MLGFPLQRIQHSRWLLGQNVEQNPCRALGFSIALLPVAKRTDADTKGTSELGLRHTDLSPNGFDV